MKVRSPSFAVNTGTIAILAIVVALALSTIVGLFGGEELPDGGRIDGFEIAWRTGLAFIIGATMSAIAGIIGLVTAVKSNVRTASAATRSLGEALRIGLRGGAVTGFTVTSLSLLGVYVLYLAYGGLDDPQTTPFLIVGYGFGASFVALFALLGGGIYTKAADVAADLVGKIEAGIPEDDPRNAAVVADLVGDNVGDCAGPRGRLVRVDRRREHRFDDSGGFALPGRPQPFASLDPLSTSG